MASRFALFAVFGFALITPAPAAAQYTWGTSPGSANWNTAGNWTGGLPVSNNFTTLTFGSSTQTTLNNNLAAGFILNQMSFSAGGPAYTISGNSLDFHTNGSGLAPSIQMASDNNVTINTALTLTNTLTTNVTGTGELRLGGLISGSSGLTKTGTGVLVLSNTSNNYSGTTTINGGVVSISSNGNLGASGAGIVLNGGTLRFTGTGLQTIASSRATTVGASGGTIDTAGLGEGFNNILTYESAISGSGMLTLNANGALSDNGGGGSNTRLILNGANNGFTGAVTISAGLVDTSSNLGTGTSAITITGGGLVATENRSDTVARNIVLSGTGDRIIRVWGSPTTMTLSGVLSGTGNLRKTDQGLAILTNANTFTGTTTVGQGTLQLNNNLALQNSVLDTSGAGTLSLVGATTPTFGGLTGNKNLSAVITSGYGSVTQLTLNTGTGVTATYSGGITPGAAGMDLVKTGAGTQVLSGTNTLTGGDLTVNGGTLSLTGGILSAARGFVNSATVNVGSGAGWNNTGLLTVNGTLNITGGVTNAIDGTIGSAAGTGTVTVGGSWSIGQSLYVNNGTLTVTGGGTVSSNDGTIGFSGGGTGVASVGGGVGASTWSSFLNLTVGHVGTGTLTVTGGGTVSNANGIIGSNSGSTGTVTVGGGTGAATWANNLTLSVGVSGSGTLNINTGGTVSATALDGGNATSAVNFNGGTLRITGTDSASNTINLLSGGGTINVANAGTTFTITSAVTGVGILTKTGNGALVLTNTGNVFNGGIQVNGGSLNVFDEVTVGVSPLRTGAGGTIRYTANQSTARTFEMAGTLEAPTGVTLTLDGATVNGGVVRSVGTGAVAVGANGASLNGVTVFAGTTINQNGGPLTADNFTFGGTHTVATSQTFTGSNLNYTASAQVNVNGTANVTNLTSVGRINVNNGGTLTQQNATTAAPLTLGGGSVTTVASGGTLNWGGSVATDQLGRLAGGVLINNGTVTGGRLVVDYGGLARGTGSYSVNPLTINGGQYSPGSSPGLGNVEAFIADGGNSYTFEINDRNGTAGATVNGRGWDLLTVRNNATPANSSFTTTATPANKFVLRLVTQNPNAGSNVNGPMDNFDPNAVSQWLLFRVDAAATNPFPNGFDANAFQIDTSGFANATNGGTFGLSRSGNDINLTFQPVPEPATVLAVAAGGLAVAGWLRRRRSANTVAG